MRPMMVTPCSTTFLPDCVSSQLPPRSPARSKMTDPGAIVMVGEHKSTLSFVFGVLAVIAATSNIVGGFLITDRMLKMFKSSRPTKP